MQKRSYKPSIIIDRRNQFQSRPPLPPYFIIPAWWRRFMFQVLSARELSLYAYICSVSNPDAVAYPLRSQVMEDLGIKTKQIVADGMARLVEAGFLLHDFRVINAGGEVKRHVYQRPTLQFTVKKLLELEEIDADLFPTKRGATRSKLGSSQSAVLTGLSNIAKDDALIDRYDEEQDPKRRRELLLEILDS